MVVLAERPCHSARWARAMYGALKVAEDVVGTPAKWNEPGATGYSGIKLKKIIGPPQIPFPTNAQEQLCTLYEFVCVRRNAASQPLTRTFVAPPHFFGQWYKLYWLPFTCASDEEIATQHKWEKAWHGTKIEDVYAISYHSMLLESLDEEQGERFLLRRTVGLFTWCSQ